MNLLTEEELNNLKTDELLEVIESLESLNTIIDIKENELKKGSEENE